MPRTLGPNTWAIVRDGIDKDRCFKPSVSLLDRTDVCGRIDTVLYVELDNLRGELFRLEKT